MNTIYGKILWRTSLPVLLLLFLAVSCKQSEQHSSWEKKYDSFYRSVTDSLTTHPQQIRALAKQKMEMSTDSLEWYYYSAIVLKTYMFTSDVDSARYLIKRIEDFCAREQSSPYLADLRSEYLNTKGNIYVRVGAMDSAIVCFTDSYKQRLQGMKTESVPDILINLADACSRQGKYDVSAFWYRKALQIGYSLGISDLDFQFGRDKSVSVSTLIISETTYFLVACKLPTLTVTVAIPFFFAVIFPLASTETMDGLELFHEAPLLESLHKKRFAPVSGIFSHIPGCAFLFSPFFITS